MCSQIFLVTVLDFLSQPTLPYGSIARIERDTGIPHQTLSEWHKIRKIPGNENWFP